MSKNKLFKVVLFHKKLPDKEIIFKAKRQEFVESYYRDSLTGIFNDNYWLKSIEPLPDSAYVDKSKVIDVSLHQNDHEAWFKQNHKELYDSIVNNL